jgi:hypothetical protein
VSMTAYDVEAKQADIDALPMRYLEIVKVFQEMLFAHPPELNDKQKEFIKLFINGKCTDWYLATKLGVSIETSQAMIEQYKQEYTDDTHEA